MLPAALLLWSGCNTLSPENEELTDEEIEIASQIIAESLSDQSGGMLSSFYDALSTVDDSGITYGSASEVSASLQQGPFNGQPPRNPGNANGRGAERNYSVVYNPETGEHTVTFTRGVQNAVVSNAQSVTNVYIYTDADGNFIEFPGEQRDLIESIAFTGLRSGEFAGPVRQSTATRTDTLFVTGLSTASTIVSLDGVHYNEGSASVTLPRAERTAERSFSNVFRMEDVRIDKAVVQENGTLEEGVTGLISYRLTMTQTKFNGETEEKDIEGVIELDGDGTALLRFGSVSNIFRIGLYSGEVE